MLKDLGLGASQLFEQRLAEFLGVKHAITVNSGSSANLVAFSTLTSPRLGTRAIKPGDEVIGVAAGFPTTVNPILQFGAVPVFVDVDLATHNIDASKIERELHWVPQETFETGMEKTVRWYLDNLDWCRRVQDGTYQRERLGLSDANISQEGNHQ